MDRSSNDMVAARSASFRQVSVSPFGNDDQIGMLNLISSSSIAAAMLGADYDHIYDLAVDYFVGMPAWTLTGDPSFQIWMSHRPQGTVVEDSMGVGRTENDLVGYSGDCITMYSHCGTHIDSLNHFGYHGKLWNGFTESEHMGSRSWRVCGPENFPPIFARGVMIDVAGALGVNVLPNAYGIGEKQLKDAMLAQGTQIREGDVVLVRTGRMTMWPTQRYVEEEPGLNREGAEFLAKAGAIVIGADNQALEQMPSGDVENWQVVHTYLLAEAGVPIVEVVNLEELARDKVFEFAFVGMPIRVRGATAAPLRPIALRLKR